MCGGNLNPFDRKTVKSTQFLNISKEFLWEPLESFKDLTNITLKTRDFDENLSTGDFFKN